jgi:anti-sigma factor RsiW
MAEPRCSALRPLLSAALDGELPAAEAATVRRHLARCGACAHEHRGLATVRSLLRNLPERALPEVVPAAAAARAGSRRRRLAAAGATVAVVTGLLGGAAFALGGQPAPPTRTVHVPMDAFVADHLVHGVNGPSTAADAATP